MWIVHIPKNNVQALAHYIVSILAAAGRANRFHYNKRCDSFQLKPLFSSFSIFLFSIFFLCRISFHRLKQTPLQRCVSLFLPFCAALLSLRSPEKMLWKSGVGSGGRGDKISHGGNNIGNGNGGGINIDTGGGDIGSIGVGVGLRPGYLWRSGRKYWMDTEEVECINTYTLIYQCRKSGNQSGSCDSGSGSPSLLGLLVGQTTSWVPFWLS